MTAQRVTLGRDVRVIAEADDHLVLEGTVRLRPGHRIDIVKPAHEGPTTRRGVLVSWAVIQFGAQGPTFSGTCRWEEARVR